MIDDKTRRNLENTEVGQVTAPDYAVLTFAVCTISENACGWGGWLLEGAFALSEDKSGILANGDNPMPSVNLQICPNCRGELFRTDTARVYDLEGLANLRM